MFSQFCLLIVNFLIPGKKIKSTKISTKIFDVAQKSKIVKIGNTKNTISEMAANFVGHMFVTYVFYFHTPKNMIHRPILKRYVNSLTISRISKVSEKLNNFFLNKAI